MTATDGASIKSRFARSGAWMIAQAVFSNLSSMLVFIALARLLTPAEFGIVAFATIFTDIGRVLVVAGIPDALIQRTDWNDDVASTAFWTTLGMGVAISLMLMALAVPVASVIDDPIFGWVLAALSLSMIIEGLTAVHGAKLRREFHYKMLAMRGMIANVASGVVGVALAYLGWGVWALVVSRLVAAMLGTLLIWASARWHPKFSFAMDHVRSFASFSMHLLGSQLLSLGNTHITSFIIGAFLGPAALGQYRVGTRALNMLVSMVITPLQSTATSAFSRMEDRERRIGGAYLRLTRMCSLIACPIFLGAAVIAPDFVQIIFGKQWEDAGMIMAVSGLIVGPAVIMYFFTPALASIGRSALAFQSGLMATLGNLVAAAVTVPFGVVAIAAGQTARSHVTLPFSLLLLKKGLGIEPRDMIGVVVRPLFAALIMAGILAALHYSVMSDILPLHRMLLMVALGAPLYAIALLLIDRRGVAEIGALALPIVRRAMRKPAAATQTTTDGI